LVSGCGYRLLGGGLHSRQALQRARCPPESHPLAGDGNCAFHILRPLSPSRPPPGQAYSLQVRVSTQLQQCRLGKQEPAMQAIDVATCGSRGAERAALAVETRGENRIQDCIPCWRPSPMPLCSPLLLKARASGCAVPLPLSSVPPHSCQTTAQPLQAVRKLSSRVQQFTALLEITRLMSCEFVSFMLQT